MIDLAANSLAARAVLKPIHQRSPAEFQNSSFADIPAILRFFILLLMRVQYRGF